MLFCSFRKWNKTQKDGKSKHLSYAIPKTSSPRECTLTHVALLQLRYQDLSLKFWQGRGPGNEVGSINKVDWNFDWFSLESTNCRAPTYCRNQWNQCPGRVVVRDAIITSVVTLPWKSMISLIVVKYKLMSHLASPLLQPHLLRILFKEEFYFIFPGLL